MRIYVIQMTENTECKQSVHSCTQSVQSQIPLSGPQFGRKRAVKLEEGRHIPENLMRGKLFY